jgi:hypothetical protein
MGLIVVLAWRKEMTPAIVNMPPNKARAIAMYTWYGMDMRSSGVTFEIPHMAIAYGVYTSQFIIKKDLESVGKYGKPDSHPRSAN